MVPSNCLFQFQCVFLRLQATDRIYPIYRNIALKGLLQSIFEDINDAEVLLSIWYSYESDAKNLQPKEKVSRTFLVYSIVKSLFIHPLDAVTIPHRVLNSLLRVFV